MSPVPLDSPEHRAFVAARKRAGRLYRLHWQWSRLRGPDVSTADLATSVDDALEAYRIALHERFPKVFPDPEEDWP